MPSIMPSIMPARSFEDISVRDWDETLRVNLSSAFYWCRQVVPDMKAANFGRIVNISSLAARGGGVVGPHYAASKAGMLGLTRYAAKDLGKNGITVNSIAPAFIEDAGIFALWTEEKRAMLKEKTFVPRLGNSLDVVRAFEYLLDSPDICRVHGTRRSPLGEALYVPDEWNGHLLRVSIGGMILLAAWLLDGIHVGGPFSLFFAVLVLGVVNLTPDSFSDGGLFYRDGRLDPDLVLAAARQMVADGAAVLDVVGGAQVFQPEAGFARFVHRPLDAVRAQRVAQARQVDQVPARVTVLVLPLVGIAQVAIQRIADELVVETQAVEPGHTGVRLAEQLSDPVQRFELADSFRVGALRRYAGNQGRLRVGQDVVRQGDVGAILIADRIQIHVGAEATELHDPVPTRFGPRSFKVVPVERLRHRGPVTLLDEGK